MNQRNALSVFYCIVLGCVCTFGAFAQAADAEAFKNFPDFFSVRQEFLSSLTTAPATQALAFKTVYRDTSFGRVRISVERDGTSFYVLFLREQNGEYPYAGTGNIIVKREIATSFMTQIRWFLSDDGLSWLTLTPKNPRTLVEYVVGGTVVKSNVVAANLLYYFIVQPFKLLHDSVRSGLDWRMTIAWPDNVKARALATDLAVQSGQGAAASALIKASRDFSLIDEYLSAAGQAGAEPIELKDVPGPLAELPAGLVSLPHTKGTWAEDRGLPLKALTQALLAKPAAQSVYLAFVDSGDGRPPQKLVLVPLRGARGGYEIFAYDSEARTELDWGQFVVLRQDSYVRVFSLPLPNS